MKAAETWKELGADSREIAALKFGIMDRPNKEIRPFKLSRIRLSPEDSVAMEKPLQLAPNSASQKRLAGRIWRELEWSEKPRFLSWEFIARNSDRTPRAVTDLLHLSEHYENIPRRYETLEGFSASLLPGDHLISLDLKSGYNHFRLHPDMRQYFTVSVALACGRTRVFEYLVLPFGWRKSGYWFCRLVGRFWTYVKETSGYRVLCCVDDFALAPSSGRASTREDCASASVKPEDFLDRYGLTRYPHKGVWGSGTQVLRHLGFVIDTVRGMFGAPESKLDAISSMARELLALSRRNRRLVRVRDVEVFIGKAQSVRLAVPETAFRLLALYDAVPEHLGTESPCMHPLPQERFGKSTRLSHAALRDLQFWRRLLASLHHRLVWPSQSTPTATVHTDASLTAYGATLARGAQEAGTPGCYEVQGFWDGKHREKTHITLLELETVCISIREFIQTCALRRNNIIRLFTDNQVVLHTVQKWVSRSPTIMAELRRLHTLCSRHGLLLELHWLPSALNLYSDRLSRRRAMDFLPRTPGIPEHWWVGESEHDGNPHWGSVSLLRPSLELLPLTPEKVNSDGFSGLMLVPCWPKQNSYRAFLTASFTHRILEPDSVGSGKVWRATLLAFSDKARRLARELKCWPAPS